MLAIRSSFSYKFIFIKQTEIKWKRNSKLLLTSQNINIQRYFLSSYIQSMFYKNGIYLMFIIICCRGMYDGFQDYNLTQQNTSFIFDTFSYNGTWYVEKNPNDTFVVLQTIHTKMLSIKNISAICIDLTLIQNNYFVKFACYYPLAIANLSLSINDEVETTVAVNNTKQYVEVVKQLESNVTICFQVSGGFQVFIDDVQVNVHAPTEESTQPQQIIEEEEEQPEYFERDVMISLVEGVENLNTLVVRFEMEEHEGDQCWWLQYDWREVVSISIAGSSVDMSSLEYNNRETGVSFSVALEAEFSPSTDVEVEFVQSEFQYQNGSFVLLSSMQIGSARPVIPFYSEEEAEALNSVKKTQKKLSSAISVSTSVWGAFGATYLISSLFSFCQLIILYNYVPFSAVLTPYRVVINIILEIFLSAGDFTAVIALISGEEISYTPNPSITEEITASTDNIDGLLEHGFSSKFLNNNWDDFLNIGLMAVKIVIARLLCFLPCRLVKSTFTEIYQNKWIYILFEVVGATPTITIPAAYAFGRGLLAHRNIDEEVNSVLLLFMSFICFISPFLLVYLEIEGQRPEKPKPKGKTTKKETQKKNEKPKSKKYVELRSKPFCKAQRKCFINFFEYFLFFFIPFLVGIGNVNLFAVGSTAYMILRLGLIVKYRSLYTKWEWFKEVFNRLIWLSFTVLYLGYWIMSFSDVLPENLTTLKSMGISSLIHILVGCIGEGSFVIIDIIIWIISSIRQKCCKSNKIQNSSKKKEQMKKNDRGKSKQVINEAVFPIKVENIEPEGERTTVPKKTKIYSPHHQIPKSSEEYFKETKLLYIKDIHDL